MVAFIPRISSSTSLPPLSITLKSDEFISKLDGGIHFKYIVGH